MRTTIHLLTTDASTRIARSTLTVALLVVASLGTAGLADEPGLTMLNGDANGDLQRDVSDAVYLFGYLFLGGPAPVELLPCDETRPASVQNGDANGDGVLDVSDPVRLLGWLYSGGPEPVSPCGHLRGSGGAATSTTVLIAEEAVVPCANGGDGETVEFSGNLHMVFAQTSDGNGGGHIQTHVNYQGVSGVGTVTGDIYRVTTAETNPIHFGTGLPLETSAVTVLNFVGRGSAVKFRMKLRFHLLITPDFSQPGRFFVLSVECR